MYTDPLAYFITWTCYGTWLPGDDRGWTQWRKGEQIPQPFLADWCQKQMSETPLYLDPPQRSIVEKTVAEHCDVRKWCLHAVNCRTNHCHVVTTANTHSGQQVRDQFKAWCKRRLKELEETRSGNEIKPRKQWWTRRGSVRLVFDEESLEAAIRYTLEAQ